MPTHGQTVEKGTVAADLRAARALIDTPEKLKLIGGAMTPALSFACDHDNQRFNAAYAALMGTRETVIRGHADILALFDRAIAASEPSVTPQVSP